MTIPEGAAEVIRLALLFDDGPAATYSNRKGIVRWMAYELPPDRHGAEIPVNECLEIRYLRVGGTYFRWRAFPPTLSSFRVAR